MFIRTLSAARVRRGPLAAAASARAVALEGISDDLARRLIDHGRTVGIAASAYDGVLELAGSLAQFETSAQSSPDETLAAPLREAAAALRRAFDPPPRKLRAGRHVLSLERPLVMGILNVAKESFYDGGRYTGVDRALARAEDMVVEGAGIIDVGGQSYNHTTPPVSEVEEAARVVPVIEALAGRFPQTPLSVDTVRSSVARAALEAGAAIVNDCSGNADPRTPLLCAAYGAADVVMHLKGKLKVREPETYLYEDVAGEIVRFLHERCEAARSAGVLEESLIVDPGLEFGKEPHDDLTILERLEEIAALGYPLLVAASRKSFMGRIFDLPASELGAPSAAVAAHSVLAGARIVRTHDIEFTVRLVTMLHAIGSGDKRAQVRVAEMPAQAAQ